MVQGQHCIYALRPFYPLDVQRMSLTPTVNVIPPIVRIPPVVESAFDV